MNTPDTIGTLNVQVTGNHEILVSLKGKIQQLINKTTSELFNIKRQWASFFINHFLQHLELQENIPCKKLVKCLKKIQNSKQQKFTQSDVVNIMKRKTINGDFRKLFDVWLSQQAVEKIEKTGKIKSFNKDIYKKLIPRIRRQLRKKHPFRKFMRVPQSNNQQAIQEQMSQIVLQNLEIVVETDQYQEYDTLNPMVYQL